MADKRTESPSFRLQAGIVLALLSPIALTLDFGSLSLADPILLTSAILLLPDLRVRPTASSHAVEILLIAYLVVMTASTTLASAYGSAYGGWFSLSESVTAWLRFAQIALVFSALSRAVRSASGYVLQLVPVISVGMALLALVGWVLALGPGVDSVLVSYRAGIAIPRAQGLFSEPAELGLFLAITFPLVASLPTTRRRYALGAVVLATCATVSPVAVGSVAVVASSWSVLDRSRFASPIDKRVSNGALVLISSIVIVVMASAVAADTATRETSLGSDYYAATVSRLSGASTGGDGSGYVRLYGSWRVAGHGLAQSPLLGSSPGNLGRLALQRDPTLASVGITESQHVWNGVALVLGTTGLVGLALFIGIGVVASRRSPLLTVIFTVYLFGSSEIFDPTIWVVLAVFLGTRRGRHGYHRQRVGGA